MIQKSAVQTAALALLLALVAASCNGQPTPATDRIRRNVLLPSDLVRLDVSVQQQLRDSYNLLQETVVSADAPASARADAYGKFAMLLHAAEYYEAAAPAYLNAQELMPDDSRWPHYLGLLYKSRGEIDRSIDAFNRVLRLRPNDVAALIRLGRIQLDRGEAREAEALFERARTIAPRAVAAVVGLGQAALARRDFGLAVHRLSDALVLDPSAASIHSPLAMAYRGLGRNDVAEAHLKQWRNTDVLVPDPLRRELDLVLDSGLSYELRGVRALDGRDFAAAARFFRQGAALAPPATPLGRSLRHKLGTALYLSGDVDSAMNLFDEVVRFAPAAGLDETAAKAHYSLGLLSAADGRDERAIDQLTKAISRSPHYTEALQALGDALRRRNRATEALQRYAEVLRVDPQAADARLGYAMSLVRLRRYREAHDSVRESMRVHPDRVEFKEVMARLLAAAPDPQVRNGARALALVEQLLVNDKTVSLGETTAMALAEVGRHQEAAAVQQQVIKAATEAQLTIDLPTMSERLALYESGRPCRVPFGDGDPFYTPSRPASAASSATALYR